MRISCRRVDLGEIEAVLGCHPGVRAACVVAHFHGGTQHLVGYCVPAGGELPPGSELAAYCRHRLPERLVPEIYLELPALPLTPHGKVDHGALPEVRSLLTELAVEHVPPAGPEEERVAGIWEEVLGVKVSATANFSVLGGDSLLATRVAAGVQREFGVALPIRTILDNPTVAMLAAELQRRWLPGAGGAGPRSPADSAIDHS